MDDIIEVTSVDDESGTSSSSSSSEEGSQPEQVASYCSEEDCDSPTSTSDRDQFPTNLALPFLGGGPGIGSGAPRMPLKDKAPLQHQSFRDRKKKEMRHGSFTYKQVSDDATPTAHRKQLFAKRSACV